MHRPRPIKQPPIDLIDHLPPAGATQWGAHAKGAVVVALRSGILSLSEALDRYRLSVEELGQWEEAFDRDGVAGLYAKSLFGRARVRRDSAPPGISGGKR
jgi:hypothetical protein